MSFLAPFYLLLSGAIAVPLLIHLLRRRVGARVEFPAARYLLRAEREHSRTLRIRNIILMVLRVLALLAVAAAAARPVARWMGAGHGPTALAIVVDNSLSASVVVDGRPLLDQFKAMAREAVAQATTADRVWLVAADGTVHGGNAGAVRAELERLEPIAAAGDLPAAVTRAASLARGAGLDGRQVALLTDGQRSAWTHAVSVPEAQVLLWAPTTPAPPNRAVTLAEARPGRWTPRGAVAARFQSRDSTTYRMTLGGRTFARGTAAANEEVVVHAAPPERGWVAGTVEIEPDELPGDNVRHFAVWIGPAPGVRVSAGAGPFVSSAVDVLRASQRVTTGGDINVVSGDELNSLPALIVAPVDPVRLGAANRALERAGVPWRFGARHAGETPVRGASFDQVTTSARYDLIAQSGAAAETLATAGRDAWIVAGPRYVIVASPLTPDATSLPVRAPFVPWLGDVLSERLSGEPGQVIAVATGARIARPAWADAIESPDGVRTPIGDRLEVPAKSGTYFLTRADHRVGALVVDPPPEESVLDRLSPAELSNRLHTARVIRAPDPASWTSMAFHAASRRSLIDPALFIALALLVVEAVMIGGRARRQAA